MIIQVANPAADPLPFQDRVDAGRRLAAELMAYAGKKPVVLGIPRGGVPVAAELAAQLHGELDVAVARKLGAPMSPELAIGAVTADGGRFLNHDIISELAIDPAFIERETARQLEEARQREARFRSGRPKIALQGRIVLLVDDGLATGATMHAAVRAVRAQAPSRLVVAVPVGSREACRDLRREADEVVCLAQPVPFGAVAAHYLNFEQVEDDRVIELLRAG
jgi:predicted phosphoribosyltransferase